MLGLSQILCYLHRVGCPYHSKTRCLWRRNRLFLGSKNLDIINKSSKSFDAYRLETQTAQPHGKPAVVCPLMLFPHPLQNRVPRVRILLPLPQTWPGIPWNSGLFRVFGWWYAVWIAAPLGVYFALFSHLVVSVSNFSVWHIINKSSKIRGALPCASLLLLKIKSVCDSLQAGRVFFDVVHLGYL